MKPAFNMPLVLLVFSVPLIATDPPVPPGGFAFSKTTHVVYWSDWFGTRVDVYEPVAAAPSTGWPGVCVLHGKGGARDHSAIALMCEGLAKRGYLAYAYDIRGNANTLAQNQSSPHLQFTPPYDPSSERKILDSAEMHHIIESNLPTLLDFDRLAMTGISQGGNHSFQAAAYSDAALPLTSGIAASYPKLLAAAPRIAPMNRSEGFMPGGVLISDQYADILFGAANQNAFNSILAGDYATVKASLDADPMTNHVALLSQSGVPLFITVAYHDWFRTPAASVDPLGGFLQPSDHHVLFNQGGHGTPDNDSATDFMDDLRLRFFDHHMKGIDNNIDDEPRYKAMVMGADPATYGSASSSHAHRYVSSWPPLWVQTRYLGLGGSMAASAPISSTGFVPMTHQVPAGYDLTQYMLDGGGSGPDTSGTVPPTLPQLAVFSHIPFVSVRFSEAPLLSDTELLGRPSATLEVLTSAPNIQLHVALFHEDPAGVEHFITSGANALRGISPGAHTLDVNLADVAMVIPAGDKLVVRIENMALHRPEPGNTRVRYAPCFTSASIALRVNATAHCAIHLPIRSTLQPRLTPAFKARSGQGGIVHPLRLDAGASAALAAYYIFVGNSGSWPAIVVPGAPPIPLIQDDFTNLGASYMFTGTLMDFAGLLDLNGSVTEPLFVPPAAGPILAGLRLNFVGLVVTSGGLLVSDPVDFVVDP